LIPKQTRGFSEFWKRSKNKQTKKGNDSRLRRLKERWFKKLRGKLSLKLKNFPWNRRKMTV